MDEMARGLARSHKIIAYCALGEAQQRVEQFDGVEYRRISTWLDRRVSHRQELGRAIDPSGWRNEPQPLINSPLWYRRFIGQVVADLSRQDCDVVNIMNVTQFIPVLRARLPKVRIVLHMHSQWLEQLDAAIIERRINAADLVLGVRNFIAAGVRRRFPSLAQRCRYVKRDDTRSPCRPARSLVRLEGRPNFARRFSHRPGAASRCPFETDRSRIGCVAGVAFPELYRSARPGARTAISARCVC
jgi:Glycosyltransferase Family 4